MSARRARPPAARPADGFATAIEAAELLELRAGLVAVKKREGKARIIQGKSTILGSVAIDDDCREAFPNAARWDYVIGISARQPTAFFVEVHSAETSDVRKMHDKLVWLLELLNREAQQKLRALPREIHWVASGRVNIPKSTPQYKRLKMKPLSQLRGPAERLELP